MRVPQAYRLCWPVDFCFIEAVLQVYAQSQLSAGNVDSLAGNTIGKDHNTDKIYDDVTENYDDDEWCLFSGASRTCKA